MALVPAHLVRGRRGLARGHPAALPDHMEPAWLTCSLATVGGALGAGLESADAVREAACTYRSQQPAH